MNPLVVILEGANGSGKTTLARMLESDANNGLCNNDGRVLRYRAFEKALAGDSKAEPLCKSLKAAGIPLNTHVDDFYVADAMQNIASPNDIVVLDRSFPSGIAYARAGIERVGTVSGDSRSILAADQRARDAKEADWRGWLQTWCDLLPRRLYVTLLVSHATGRARTAERTRWYPTPEQHEKLEAQFILIHSLISGPRLSVDTELHSPAQILSMIKERVFQKAA